MPREFEAETLPELIQQMYGQPMRFPVRVKITENIKPRTNKQLRSIWMYCTMLSDKFNEGGLDRNAVLSAGVERPWRKESVMEDIWRIMQIAMTGKESTGDLETHEVSAIYEKINAYTAQRFGVSLDFPNRFGPEGEKMQMVPETVYTPHGPAESLRPRLRDELREDGDKKQGQTKSSRSGPEAQGK